MRIKTEKKEKQKKTSCHNILSKNHTHRLDKKKYLQAKKFSTDFKAEKIEIYG